MIKVSKNKCKCGKDAVAIAYLPVENVYVGIVQVTERTEVCIYHAEKSKEQGYVVEYF